MRQILKWTGRHAGKIFMLGLATLGAAAIIPGIVPMRMSRMPEGRTGNEVQRASSYLIGMGDNLEDWKRKQGSYPGMTPLEPPQTLSPGAFQAMDFAGLTTMDLPEEKRYPDYFSYQASLPLAYHTDGKRWLLFSAGPDKVYDFHPDRLDDPARALDPAARVEFTYDPTNGVFSSGDLFRASETTVERPS